VSSSDHDALDRLVLAEQDERRRLALFLHDGPVQNLAGIALMLDGALHALGGGSTEQAEEIVRDALRRQRATIRELRDLSFALEPVVLRDEGLSAALQAFADQTRASHRVAVELALEDADSLGETAQIALYAILRELVDQALRRGPPTRITVAVARSADGGVHARVSDDAEPERRRRSMDVIRERTEQLHGTVELVLEDARSAVLVTLPAHTARR
jgi:signal transduction histidine kinase